MDEELLDTVVVVRGTVQGVGFRWWTRRQLEQNGMTGTAVNRADGAVEIRVRGSYARTERMIRVLRGGTTPGHVTAVDVVSSTPVPGSAQ
jgi:acylphosphatase